MSIRIFLSGMLCCMIIGFIIGRISVKPSKIICETDILQIISKQELSKTDITMCNGAVHLMSGAISSNTSILLANGMAKISKALLDVLQRLELDKESSIPDILLP
jgi:hypothetical protein